MFRLALQLGCTVEELLHDRKLSAFELTYWYEFFKREPWGGEVDNFRFGTIAQQVVNMTPRKGGKAMSPMDFYPRFGPAEDSGKFSPEQLEFLAKRKKARKKPPR